MEKVKKSSFEGKTIKEIDTRCVNVIVFHFTDGTKIGLETEHAGHGIYGFSQYTPDTASDPTL